MDQQMQKRATMYSSGRLERIRGEFTIIQSRIINGEGLEIVDDLSSLEASGKTEITHRPTGGRLKASVRLRKTGKTMHTTTALMMGILGDL